MLSTAQRSALGWTEVSGRPKMVQNTNFGNSAKQAAVTQEVTGMTRRFRTSTPYVNILLNLLYSSTTLK